MPYSILSSLKEVEKQLRSQKTFEAGLTALQQFVLSNCKTVLSKEIEDQLQYIFKRIIILLKSRYSSPAFWKAAEACFLNCQLIINGKNALAEQVDAGIKECIMFSRTHEEEPIQSHTASLFEGQLTNEAEHEAQQPSTSVEQILSQMFAMNMPNSENASQQQPVQGLEVSDAFLRHLEEMQMMIMDMDDSGQAQAPPASKKAIKRLKKVILNEKILETLKASNTDVLCSICQEDFKIGETMSIMPCNSHHSFHPSCLKPWLNEHNSCPICRFELETDNLDYEAKKIRKQQDEEANKGARNAQSHNDFLYI